MQENRSFDHYFGTLKGVRGFADRFTIPLPNGRRVWEQLRSNGQVLTPFHLDGTANNAQRADGTPHTWDDSQLAWDNGRMANWPTHKTDISMGYFKEKKSHISLHLPMPLRFVMPTIVPCTPEQMRTALFI